MTVPYLNSPVFSWPAAPGGLLYTYSAGGVAAKTTYEEDGVTPNQNPVVLDTTGTAIVRGSGLYHFLLKDSTGANTLWDADYYLAPLTTQSDIATNLTPQTVAEAAAGVSPVFAWFEEGDIRRYGAVLDGISDDTVPVQNWAKVGGALKFPVAQTALISAEIPLYSGTTIQAAQGSMILQTANDVSIFHATTQNAINIYGMHFKQNKWGANAYVGHVFLDSCLHCTISDCEFEGVQWAGVYLKATQYSTIRGNYFHDSFPQQSIAFSVAPNATAVSGTLSAAWTLPTGAYTVLFVETSGGAYEGKQVTLTNGATTATWSGGLSANCNAAITVQCATEASDIVINPSASAAATYNVIDGNRCFSNTLACGISLEDPYSGVLPSRNIITNNRITDHIEYGILVYMPDTGDSYTHVTNNFIENISGKFALNISSGAGIYVTGAGIGGSVITGNIVRNCCINTSNSSLAPAGIGITAGSVATGIVPLTVSNNVVSDMTQYHGILFTGTATSGNIANNTVRMPSTNTTGHGIAVNNAASVNVTGNTIILLDVSHSMRGIILQGLGGVNCINVNVTGNNITGGNYHQIETSGTSGGLVTMLTICGNNISGGTSASVPLALSSAQDVMVTGNYMTTTNNTATISQASCTNVIYSNNRLAGGTVVLAFTGTNTGSHFGKSNLGVADASISNGGTGCIVEWIASGNSDPSSGTFAVGDIVWRSDATSGQRILSACTNATSHGTWKTVSLS